MLVVYGIKNCDTCRKAQKFLGAREIEFRFHDVREDGLDIQMLERWADRLGWEQLLNKRSTSWRELAEADKKDVTRNKALALILDKPTLIKRPVFETKRYTGVGFSEKRFEDFLNKFL